MKTSIARRSTSASLPVCIAGMDSCWIFMVAWLVWAGAFSALLRPPAPPLVLALLELAAWWLANYLLDRTALAQGAIQALSGLAGVALSVVVALAFNPPASGGYSLEWLQGSLFTIIVCLVLWFLGGYRASQRPAFNEAFSTFRVAVIAVGLTAVLVTVIAGQHISSLLAGLGGVPIWLFAWSLAALILGHQEVVREESGTGITGSWGLVSAVSVSLVLLVGLLGGAFGGQDLLGALQQLAIGALRGIALIIYGVVFVITWLLSLFHFNPALPSNNQPTPTPTAQAANRPDPLGQLQKQFESQPGIPVPPELRDLVLWGAAVLAAVLAAWLITRGTRRMRRQRQRDATEERISLGAWPRLEAQLRLWLAHVLARFRKQAETAAASEDELEALRGRPEWSGTLSIRQIYARLQSAAARIGLPRSPHATPIEYFGVLASAKPELHSDLELITSAYIEARYGPLPASAPAVTSANEAWKRTEPAFRGDRTAP